MLLSSGNTVSQKRGSRPTANLTNANRPIANGMNANLPFPSFNAEWTRPGKKRVSRYQFNLSITEGPKYSVSITSPDRAGQIDALDLESLVTDLSGGGSAFYLPYSGVRKVIIEASPNITMFELWRPIELFPLGDTEIILPLSLRADPGSPESEVRLKVSGKSETSVFELPIMPNPLLLVLTLDQDGMLLLNNEPFGTLSDTEPLRKKLLELFKEREANGAFRDGTNEVEKSVTILMPMSQMKVSDLMTVARAVWFSGGTPISLAMDGPIENRSPLIDFPGEEFAFPTPPSPPPKKKTKR